jgi:predicted acylesterase/phospholipase RssA
MSLTAKIANLFRLLPRNITVDTGLKIRVTLELVDEVTASPIADADVAIEQSATAKNPPVVTDLGRTDSRGKVDVTTAIGWSYLWHEWRMNPDVAAPPLMCVSIKRIGFRDARVYFLIDTLSRVAEAYQLPLGSRVMAVTTTASPASEDFKLIDLLRSRPIALVLAGGGFKGAYQIGVLKALRKLGVDRFSAIAGTSAGALNAILVAADELDKAETVWREANMMQWSPRSWGVYLLAYCLLLIPYVVAFVAYGVLVSMFSILGSRLPIYMLLLALILAFTIEEKMSRVSKSGERYAGRSLRVWLKVFRTSVFVGVFAAFGYWIGRGLATELMRAKYGLIGTAVFVQYAASFAGSVVPGTTKHVLHIVPPFTLYGIAFAIAMATFFNVLAYALTADLPPAVILVYSAIAMVGMIVCMVAGAGSGSQLTGLFRYAQRDGQLFSNAEILAKVDAHLDLDKIRSRVGSLFVTVARSCRYLDPFRQKVTDVLPWRLKVVTDPTSPGETFGWTPEYSPIHQYADKAQAIERFRLTSALPMMFQMGETAAEEMLVDGGLVDNVPITPILWGGPDVVVVLLLDERGMTPVDVYRHINRTWRLWVTPQLTQETALELYKAWLARKPLLIPDFEAAEIEKGKGLFDIRESIYANVLRKPFRVDAPIFVIIAPGKPLCISTLGPLRFVTGTLNFLLSYRRKWLCWGYDETWEALSTGRMHAGMSVFKFHPIPEIQVNPAETGASPDT